MFNHVMEVPTEILEVILSKVNSLHQAIRVNSLWYSICKRLIKPIRNRMELKAAAYRQDLLAIVHCKIVERESFALYKWCCKSGFKEMALNLLDWVDNNYRSKYICYLQDMELVKRYAKFEINAAAKLNNLEMVKHFKYSTQDSFIQACRHGNLEMVKYLFEMQYAKYGMEDAILHERHEVVEWLSDYVEPIPTTNHYKIFRYGTDRMIQELLDSENFGLESAFQGATDGNRVKWFKVLLRYGNPGNSLHNACAKGLGEIVELHDIKDRQWYSFMCVIHNHHELALKLCNSNGTRLAIAIVNGDVEEVRRLKDEEIPMEHFLRYVNEEMIEILQPEQLNYDELYRDNVHMIKHVMDKGVYTREELLYLLPSYTPLEVIKVLNPKKNYLSRIPRVQKWISSHDRKK